MKKMRLPCDAQGGGKSRPCQPGGCHLSKSLGAVCHTYAVNHGAEHKKSKYSKLFSVTIASSGNSITSKKVDDAILFLRLVNGNSFYQRDISYLNTSNIH